MAAVVQTNHGADVSGSQTNMPVALTAASTAGNLLMVTVGLSLTNATTTGTITPPAGWLSGTQVFDGNHRYNQNFILPNCPGGVTSYPFTIGNVTGNPETGFGWVISELSGVPRGLTLHSSGASAQNASTTARTTLTVTAASSTNQQVALEIAGFRNSSASTSETFTTTPSGFTLAGSQPDGNLGVVTVQYFRLATAPETPTYTYTWTDSVAADSALDTWISRSYGNFMEVLF